MQENENQNEEKFDELEEVEILEELTEEEEKGVEGGASAGFGFSEVFVRVRALPESGYLPVGSIALTLMNGTILRNSKQVGTGSYSTIELQTGRTTIIYNLFFDPGMSNYLTIRIYNGSRAWMPKSVTLTFRGVNHLNYNYKKLLTDLWR